MPDKELITVFNTRQTILYYNELLTSRIIVSHFCIYYDYKCKMHNDDNNKSKDRLKIRSRQMN